MHLHTWILPALLVTTALGFVPPPEESSARAEGGSRQLFVHIDESTGEAKDLHTEEDEDSHHHARRQLAAFPELHGRRLASEELAWSGHDNILSRMVLLAEAGEMTEAMGMEQVGEGQGPTAQATEAAVKPQQPEKKLRGRA
jgi:hypothetical protein